MKDNGLNDMFTCRSLHCLTKYQCLRLCLLAIGEDFSGHCSPPDQQVNTHGAFLSNGVCWTVFGVSSAAHSTLKNAAMIQSVGGNRASLKLAP